MSSANLHLPQKALFSGGQCPIKETVLLHACVTVCSVSMMTCCQCPEELLCFVLQQPCSATFLFEPGWRGDETVVECASLS